MSPFHESFAFFSKLPIELRLMVYNHSISLRVIEVQYNHTQNSCISKDVPPLLLVSREARAEALKRYELSFGTRTKVKSAIYLNYELDSVIFDWGSFRDNYVSNCMRYEECRRIKRIRIPDKTLDFLTNNQMRDLSAFTGLEEISISGCCGRVMNCREDPKIVVYLLEIRGYLLDERGMDYANLAGDQLIPKFVCVEGGGNCTRHAWFREWNEWTALGIGFPRGLRKASWMSVFTETYRDLAEVAVDDAI